MFFCKLKYLCCMLIFAINIKCLKTFNVNFHYNNNLHVEPFNTQIYKRELTQFFDKASFSLNGFEKVESIPILFPIDICVFNLEDSRYAAALHMEKNGARHFKILKMNNGSYELIVDIHTPNGVAMDCINFNNKGYIAIAFNLTEPVKYAKEGSPIYEIAGNRLKAVQYFASPNLMSVYLRASGNDLFLLHTYANSQDSPNLHCPYFKWSGSTFNKMGRIPCSNARQLAPFSIDYESYVAVANYADQRERTSTNSEIYKFSRDKKKFVLFQKIKTNGAVDVQYFSVPQNEVKKQHFLVFANSISTASSAKKEKAKREGKNLEADSVFYLFEKGQFIPYQKLSLYAVNKFLPVQNVEAEKFILLVACTDQDIKIYNLNDWKFEESKVQFTEGALGKGVSNMRIYQENEKSFLIIANELMSDNETNIFLPIFKQEEQANVLRQHIIDWAKGETQRLEAVNVKDLKKLVEEKLNTFKQLKYLPKIRVIPQGNIQTVTTESLVYPKLKMSRNYWISLNYANQALDTLETMIKQKQRFKRETEYSSNTNENLAYVYEKLNVNNMTISKNLKAQTVNKVGTVNPEFNNFKAQKVVINGKYIKPTQERVNSMESLNYRDDNEFMTVRNLQINGKLNDFLWSELLNNTLKRNKETQFIKASIQVKNLKCDTIMVNSGRVNEQNLAVLIPADGGQYVINQDVQFTAPITANRLEIFDRLNNLHVFKDKFDVLLKKSNKTQVIEGIKNVTNVKVLKPITITGKMIGRQLEAISPNKFIHEPLVLQGNYMINGDAHIRNQLNCLDLIDLNEKLSAKQVLDMGIRMDKSLKDVNLKFVQPLKANNSLVSFVNQHDLQRLVKLNQNDIQIIEGFKVFNETLKIGTGFSEVKNLNGVDIEKLEKNAFLKNNNQTIIVPMKIGKITAKSIESPNLILNSKNLSDLLTLTGNQSIQGSLIVDNLKAQFLTVEHLNTDRKIFHQHLQDIYQQKFRNAPQDDVLQKNRKLHGTIYVQNLILNSTINNRAIEEIENQILQLEGNIKYVGNFKFNYPMNVTNMTFQGKLNGIRADDFGKCWLQKKAEKQEFTASQSIATVNAKEGIQLQGKLNGFTMKDFYSKTFWVNRDEYMEKVNFENPIEMTDSLTTHTLNDVRVPEDVLQKLSKGSPIILNSLSVSENIIVQGKILNLTTINNINLFALDKFLDDSNDNVLYMENAFFSYAPPIYKTLNKHFIRNTLDIVWLANENVVLPNHVEITNAYFEGLLEFKGPINAINLDNLKENYFSKTKPQEVPVELVFLKVAKCVKEVNMKTLQVYGPLIEGERLTRFNFDEFVQTTLKTSGPHIIGGKWSLLEIAVKGNLNGVLINQLKLVDDIIHTVKLNQAYLLKAVKIFKNAYIENLHADSASIINKIPLVKWINDAVFLYENYTVKGVTIIDFLNVYNNVIVLGKVNNVTYNEHTLLLHNLTQHIPGNMKIVSHLVDEKRFLTNNIENLYAEYINRQYMSEFIQKLIPTAASTKIKGHLIFKHVLKVEKYEGPEGFLTQNQWRKRNINDDQLNRDYVERTNEMFAEFVKTKDFMQYISDNHAYKLDHFDIVQIIETKSSEIVVFSISMNQAIVDILAVINRKGNVTFYEWIAKKKQFQETRVPYWLPKDSILLKIIQRKFEATQQPLNADYLKLFIQKDLKAVYHLLNNSNYIRNSLTFLNNNCITYENQLSESAELKQYCFNVENSEKFENQDKAKQILGLNEKYLAQLTNNSVLIYDASFKPVKILQKLPTVNSKEISFGFFKKYNFLAILNKAQSNTLNIGYVDIYRSINSSAFILFQSLECSQPEQLKFFFLEKTNDFLLLVLTRSFHKPFLIYQYQGIMGFQEILSDSILPANSLEFNLINLYSSEQYLVVLKGKHNITVIEITLKKI